MNRNDFDATPEQPDQVFEQTIAQFEENIQVPNSAVILLHDQAFPLHTNLIERLAIYFRERNYTFITSDECASYCTQDRCRGVSGPQLYDHVFIP